MTPTTTPPAGGSVKELLPQFEAAQTALEQADGLLTAKSDKLNGAVAEFTTAVTSENDAIDAYNAAADAMAAALTASKRKPVALDKTPSTGTSAPTSLPTPSAPKPAPTEPATPAATVTINVDGKDVASPAVTTGADLYTLSGGPTAFVDAGGSVLPNNATPVSLSEGQKFSTR